MGQNSSKRRSSKGRGKNESYDISQRANGDDPNGSIEAHPKRENSPPTSPTSLTSASPSHSSGKKEKKKRFRVGFSLKRTPSGRWSRKKKTSSLNGIRPVSCPDPLRPELAEKPDRPHSLFLEELDIPEEDTKVETVDLSDNEESKKKPADEDKSAPKAPERSKWKRGSHKKSSGKKKKKEKPTPKKEKKKKQKSGEDVIDVVATPHTIDVVATPHTIDVVATPHTIDVVATPHTIDVVATPHTIDVVATPHTIDAVATPHTVDAVATPHTIDAVATPGVIFPAQKTINETNSHEHKIEVLDIELAKDVPTFEKQKSGDDSTDIADKQVVTTSAQMTVELANNHEQQIEVLNKEYAKNEPMFEKEEEEIDVDAIAASIVAEALEIAQNRLRAEACNDVTSTIYEDHIAQQVRTEISSFERLNSTTEVAAKPSNETPVEAGTDITTTHPEEIESTTKIAQDIAEIPNKSMETIPEPSMDLNFTTASKNDAEVDKTEHEGTSIPNTDISTESQIRSEQFKMTSISLQVKTENISLANSAILHSNVHNDSNNATEDAELSAENDESEAIAKQIVEHVIAASVQVVLRDGYVNENPIIDEVRVLRDGYVNENPIIDEVNNNFTMRVSDLHNDNISSRHEQEKEKTKLNTKNKVEDKSSKKDKKKDKENVEENAGGKSDKEKPKSETKMKVTKKLSNWFHKKDKHSKLVTDTAGETSVTDATKQSSHAASSEHTTESELGQKVESVTEQIPHYPTESQSSDPSSCFNTSLQLDVNVTPSVIEVETPTESQSSDPSSCFNTSLQLDVNVTPSVIEVETPTESSTDYSDVLSPPSSISPSSPISDSEEATSGGDKSFGSSFLKKISIGPRLRTAILRKKSSGSSDDQDKSKSPLPLQTNAESADLKPPPRKSRQRKSESQRSPDTPRTHNAASSPDSSPESFPEVNSSSTEPALQLGSIKTNITTDDSGIADLTSLEGDKSVSTWGDESKEDCVPKRGENAAIAPVTHANILPQNFTENSQTDHVDGHSTDDEDDTRPLPQGHCDDAVLYDVHSKNMNYYSPLQSPTLISTASIVLRSVSRDEGVELGDKYLAGDTSLNLKTQPNTSSELSTDSMSIFGERCCVSAAPTSGYILNSNIISTENVSERPSSLDNEYKHDHPDQQTQNVVVASSTQAAVETNVGPCWLENASCVPRQDIDIAAPPRHSKKNLFQKFSHPQARTIAEYSIGEIVGPGGATGAMILQDNQQTFNSVEGSTVPPSWLDEATANDNSLIHPYIDAAIQEDSSQAEIHKVFKKETKNSLKLQSAGAYEQTDVPSFAIKVNQHGLNMSQITGCSNDVLEADSVNNNGHREDESLCLKDNNSIAFEGYKDKSDVLYQKDVGLIEENSNFSEENERTIPVDANVVYQTFLNGDLPVDGESSS